MYKIISSIAKIGVVILLSACVSAPGSVPTSSLTDSQRDAEDAYAARQAALDALNNGGNARGGGQSVTTDPPTPRTDTPGTGGASTVGASTDVPVKSGARPAWVASKDAAYNEADYISETGSGPTESAADQRAFATLTALFGRTVQWDNETMTSYREVMEKNSAQIRSSTSVDDSISISTQLDTLIGAQIADRWYDSSAKTYYSIAVMDRARTRSIYTDIINANVDTINQLIGGDRYSFDGYIRYQQAAVIADANQIYANVLSVIGDTANVRGSLKSGAAYRSEAKSEILPNIPIAVNVKPMTPNVTSVMANNIKTAFMDAVKDKGFRTGGTNSRYQLNVEVSLEEVSLTSNKFSRITVNAAILDSQNGNELSPYQFNRREGHVSLSEAENRAVRWAVTNIGGAKTGFGAALQEYLDSMAE